MGWHSTLIQHLLPEMARMVESTIRLSPHPRDGTRTPLPLLRAQLPSWLLLATVNQSISHPTPISLTGKIMGYTLILTMSLFLFHRWILMMNRTRRWWRETLPHSQPPWTIHTRIHWALAPLIPQIPWSSPSWQRPCGNLPSTSSICRTLAPTQSSPYGDGDGPHTFVYL